MCRNFCCLLDLYYRRNPLFFLLIQTQFHWSDKVLCSELQIDCNKSFYITNVCSRNWWVQNFFVQNENVTLSIKTMHILCTTCNFVLLFIVWSIVTQKGVFYWKYADSVVCYAYTCSANTTSDKESVSVMATQDPLDSFLTIIFFEIFSFNFSRPKVFIKLSSSACKKKNKAVCRTIIVNLYEAEN